MKKVFIKYNPYTIKTEITVDGKHPAQNSLLTEKAGLDDPNSENRLQEWIEDFPEILKSEYADDSFDITFHGIMQDFDDIAEVFQKTYDTGLLSYVKLDRIPAKETDDKEKLISDVFKKIINGPFEELKSEDIKKAFSLAQNEDFEVCVIATMSAGKSTLINSMLGTKLMPSKQEACTAIITRIKDTDSSEWQAEVYNKEQRLIESYNQLTLEAMNRLNSDSNVSTIKVNGDIPFVQSDDVSLVLIDTPGPNNARDPEHGKVQRGFLDESSKSLVLYIMTATFGTDDDNALLDRVAESMAVNGKQSKDRFIFVVNKMDDRRKEDGDTEDTLKRVKDYLKSHGINNPNLFPAAALPALNIHLMKNDSSDDEDTIEETDYLVRKLNKQEHLHLEKYAPLSLSAKGQIKNQLKFAKDSEDKYQQALIHTGIPSIEAAIRQYVLKYAKTAKIKNIVDTFRKRLEADGSMAKAQMEITRNWKEKDKIINQINSIETQIYDLKNAQNFDGRMKAAIADVKNTTNESIDETIIKFRSKIQEKTKRIGDLEFSIEAAEEHIQELNKYSRMIEKELKDDLELIIKNNLIAVSEALMKEYKNKLRSLEKEISLDDKGIKINPLELMNGSLDDSMVDVANYIQSREIVVGQEWVKNTDKKWYKPWTWFQESGYYCNKYQTEKYVNGSEIAEEYLSQVEEPLDHSQ